MRHARVAAKEWGLSIGVGALIALAGCGDEPTIAAPNPDPEEEGDVPGAIQILTVTTGDSQPDEYFVTIDDTPAGRIGATGDLTLPGVEPGDHQVELSDVPDNCRLAGLNPRLVTVAAEQSTSTVFELTCAPVGGSLLTRVVTTGIELDPDGFVVGLSSIDGVPGDERPLEVNGAALFDLLPPGDYLVELSGIAANCLATSANPSPSSVRAGVTDTVTFAVECADGPDGRLVYTVRDALDSYAIWTMDAVGSNQRRIVANAWDADWSPDGTRLVYAGSGGVFVIGLNGGVPELVTDYPWFWDVAWSPLGERIAATGFVTSWAYQVAVVELDGSDSVVLTGDGVNESEPAWSPDGARLAFISDRDGQPDLYVANPDGSSPIRLTFDPWQEGQPAWSPDGTRIVFHSNRTGDAELFLVGIDGSDPRRLTASPSQDRAPDWSPDGTQIAFQSDRHGSYDIYVVNVDGTGLARVTDGPDDETHPRWAP